MATAGVPMGRVVVALPYAPLVAEARRAWSALLPDGTGLTPRFTTLREWAAALAPWRAGSDDISHDMARDALVAGAWIDRVAGARADAGLRRELVARLIAAARQLAPLAAALPPGARGAWAEARRGALATIGSAASTHWESLVANLAVTWAASSGQVTDALWSPIAAPGADADRLLVLPGPHPDPLADALLDRWGPQGGRLTWSPPDAAPPSLWSCDGFEPEAQAAAASVIAHLNAGRTPVALIANDRLLTRRASALLVGAGVRLKDETGWKLSTTHAAASFMALMRAADARASTDDVLEWLKVSPALQGESMADLERQLRQKAVSRWATAPVALRDASVESVRASLQAPRPLVHWLRDTAQALALSGQWDLLQADEAGRQLIGVLRLGEAAHELDGLGEGATGERERAQRWTLAGFAAWTRDVLEGGVFQPEVPGVPQVIVMPMAQRLGRSVAAVVVPGCDDQHLSPSPEPDTSWSAAQRAALGLPERDALAQAQATAWAHLFGDGPVDALWRRHDGADALLPSAFVDGLPESPGESLLDARPTPAGATSMPAASAPALLPQRFSASAYDDLRTCPYRFFARRQLRLDAVDELDAEPDQSDLGNWLHAVLKAFHEQRGDLRPGQAADRAAMDMVAERVAQTMGLGDDAREGGFLPYRAVWPALRDAYLNWLWPHEDEGWRFEAAEAEREQQAGRWTLFGRLDRIDVRRDGEGDETYVIDHKTESRTRTEARVKEPLEDTQLAFYAALLPAQRLRAGYLSIVDTRGEQGEAARLIKQPDILTARDAILEGLQQDLARVADGAPMRALGEGVACDFCAARGLCRKDFWA
ncbi:MAG: PD-(D/E)XK nuclease family protein [Hydrogenophaga sp.]|uniref:PD-(D/E)XK nuclease family protein n=1 Tax=Hydrogenophaga sp. TaxID=1904254 RepID=UPI001D28A9DD|nr:PD-(D/E)XK nuclease family protein [Hydrogenophaga sp.]MBX3611454.1 PD-(D/E)XK nuclease family protein [Hydrogenophaga sp.]